MTGLPAAAISQRPGPVTASPAHRRGLSAAGEEEEEDLIGPQRPVEKTITCSHIATLGTYI